MRSVSLSALRWSHSALFLYRGPSARATVVSALSSLACPVSYSCMLCAERREDTIFIEINVGIQLILRDGFSVRLQLPHTTQHTLVRLTGPAMRGAPHLEVLAAICAPRASAVAIYVWPCKAQLP